MKKNLKKIKIPSREELIKPLIKVLTELGGSGNIEEINEKIYQLLKLKDEVIQIPHSENDSRTEIEYRLAWTRTYLKKFGLLTNSERGVWAFAKANFDLDEIDVDDVAKIYRNKARNKVNSNETQKIPLLFDEIETWKDEMLRVLLRISPGGFEKLVQRILRESGFTQVEVTGRSGDGGIDGKGIVRINGFLSFHIIFQCKRYKRSVGAGEIRDFRGAMQGRADKGLFITTGSFTRDAIKEATRDGAPPIDLIDGELLCDKLKELRLGVQTKSIESIEVNQEWFNSF